MRLAVPVLTMARTFPSILAALVLALASLHCGGRVIDDATGDASAGGGMSPDEFRAALVAARCDRIGRCCTESGVSFGESELAACRARIAKEVDDLHPTGPHRTIDTAMAKECVDNWAKATDECSLFRVAKRERLTNTQQLGACSAVVRDNRAPLGALCIDGACAASAVGPARCVEVPSPDGVTVEARCVAYVRAKLGEPCGRSENVVRECWVADGLRCSTAGQCELQSSPGHSCAADRELQDCNELGYCTGYICKPKGELHQGCMAKEPAIWFGCVPGTQCVFRSATCETPAPLLAPCREHQECETQFCTGGRCVHELSKNEYFCGPSTGAPG